VAVGQMMLGMISKTMHFLTSSAYGLRFRSFSYHRGFLISIFGLPPLQAPTPQNQHMIVFPRSSGI
jgi:hypothetical protein